MRHEDLYRQWKRWEAASFGAVAPEEAAYFHAELSRGGIAGVPLDVLEIGFGNGSFMGFCSRSGWSVVGTEADEELVRRARASGFECYASTDPLTVISPARSFDLIVAFDVFEHIEIDALVRLLEGLGKQLKPGGRIVARFPSGDSPFSGAIYHGDMTHRSYIGTSKMQQIAIAAGLELVFIGGAALPLRGVGVRRALRRMAVLLMRRLIFAVLKATFYSNTPRVLAPNAVAILSAPSRA